MQNYSDDNALSKNVTKRTFFLILRLKGILKRCAWQNGKVAFNLLVVLNTPVVLKPRYTVGAVSHLLPADIFGCFCGNKSSLLGVHGVGTSNQIFMINAIFNKKKCWNLVEFDRRAEELVLKYGY